MQHKNIRLYKILKNKPAELNRYKKIRKKTVFLTQYIC